MCKDKDINLPEDPEPVMLYETFSATEKKEKEEKGPNKPN